MIRTTFAAIPNRTLVVVSKAVVAAVFSALRRREPELVSLSAGRCSVRLGR